jgi:preprotein translocase subunit SecF
MTALALKYLLPVAAVIALLFGVYELGSGHGYKSGYQVAWDTQQKTINNMSAADDKRNTQDNKVINQVEQAAPVAVAQVKQEVAAQQTQNVKIIREYYEKNPDLNKLCSWSQSTVGLINQIIQPAPVTGN